MPALRPEDVFTPRSPQLNVGMYVERPDLERHIVNGLRSQKHLILFGESGNGKTWLYTRVFQREQVFYTVLNLASANYHGDLSPVFEEKLAEFEVERRGEQQSEVKSGFMPQNIGAQVTNTTRKTAVAKSDLLQLLIKIREVAGAKTAVLVLDNFEQVQNNDDIVRQIASIIVLLDDPAMAVPNVKFVVVGVPGNIRSLLSRTTSAATISNRMTEVPEVARLTAKQSRELMQRGFEEKLRLKPPSDKEKFYSRLAWNTDRIAQHIHELCLSISRLALDNGGSVDDDVVLEGEKEWLHESLAADYTVVEQLMNSRDTKAGRKNQTLYALGKCESPDFKNKDIELIVRAEFPKSTSGVMLDIPGIMSKFSSSDNPIVRRNKKEEAYRFVSPKYRMAIRTVLARDANEKVVKALSI